MKNVIDVTLRRVPYCLHFVRGKCSHRSFPKFASALGPRSYFSHEFLNCPGSYQKGFGTTIFAVEETLVEPFFMNGSTINPVTHTADLRAILLTVLQFSSSLTPELHQSCNLTSLTSMGSVPKLPLVLLRC